MIIRNLGQPAYKLLPSSDPVNLKLIYSSRRRGSELTVNPEVNGKYLPWDIVFLFP